MKTLILFTGSYPYSVAAENTFIPQELAVLGQHFKRIILVPVSIEGECDKIDLSFVTVNTDFAKYARSKSTRWIHRVLSVGDLRLTRECIAHAPLFARYPAAFRRALGYNVQARIVEAWIHRFLTNAQLESDEPILYTWWFDAPTLGLSTFGRKNGVPVLTRAHGYDLYESRHTPPYIPFRQEALDRIDRVYPDSRAGERYLKYRFPAFESKIQAGLLGIEDPRFLNLPSSDEVFRMLSCSFLVPVKRINLLLEGLAQLGSDMPGETFEWTHIGDGPNREALTRQAATSLPANVRWQFHEYPGRERLSDYYRTHRVDLFINVSQSEGTPVSIIEALSVGIPLLCTAVGGNTEVVGSDNGLLIASDPEPKEISEGIQILMNSPEKSGTRRAASRARWNESYNALTNYSSFAESLQKL